MVLEDQKIVREKRNDDPIKSESSSNTPEYFFALCGMRVLASSSEEKEQCQMQTISQIHDMEIVVKIITV